MSQHVKVSEYKWVQGQLVKLMVKWLNLLKCCEWRRGRGRKMGEVTGNVGIGWLFSGF